MNDNLLIKLCKFLFQKMELILNNKKLSMEKTN